jgi:hypothetical protein
MFTACLRANYLTLERHVQARHFAEEEMPRKLKAKRAAEYSCRPLPKSCLIDLFQAYLISGPTTIACCIAVAFFITATERITIPLLISIAVTVFRSISA